MVVAGMSEETELRIYCVMRTDLKAPHGKLIGQAMHAAVGCISHCHEIEIGDYIASGQPKIVKKAKNLHALLRAERECQEAFLPHYLVTDEARTVFPEPTITCLGIGPVLHASLPKYIRKMQLLEWLDGPILPPGEGVSVEPINGDVE